MNEQERAELESLKAQQGRLEHELSLLAGKLTLLEQRLARTKSEPIRIPTPAAKPNSPPSASPRGEAAPDGAVGIAPPPIPPVIPVSPRTPDALRPEASSHAPLKLHVEPAQTLSKGACQNCGGHLEFPIAALGTSIVCPHCAQSTLLSDAPAVVPVPPPVSPTAGLRAERTSGTGATPPPGAKVVAKGGSLEMRLGTYWLVRVGIVMVLIGLVFFGNLAYHNYISQLGAGGKVSLLYMASLGLLGAGWWWQRQAVKETLRNYAQVLFAGGLAAFYFTTYAAHHIEQLRVINSPVLDGMLLLACAGFMVWNADHRQSEVLALFAVGLAYLASIMTRVGYFTLYSNLVLTLAAVVFLVRNRWAALSLGSLVATYAGYGFWRFFDGSAWHWASPQEGLWSGVYFLMSYWLLFTAAVFLSRGQKLAGENRAGFLTLNNAAFFTLFLLTMMQVHHGGFWKFSLGYGVVLLGLAELARRVLAQEPLAKNFYLTQGLLLVTLGFISHPKLAGLNLALILAVESVVLLLLGQQRKNLILLTGAYLAAGLAVGWGMDGMLEHEPAGIWLAIGLGGLMMVNTLLVHRKIPAANNQALRPQPSYFAVLALLIWLVATWDNTARQDFPLWLAGEGVVLTLSIYLLRVREVALLSQGYLLLAQLVWFYNWIDRGHSLPWWNPALLLTLSLALSHWWQKQKVLELPAQMPQFWQGLYALATIGLLYCWLSPHFQPPGWLAFTSLLAVGLTAYGVLTRAWFVAACGQIFVLVSGAQFFWQIIEAKPDWHFPLAPIAALSLLSFGTVQWFRGKPGAEARVREPLLQIALLYRWVALVMSLIWICDYIPARERIWLLALLGLWIFLWAGLKRNVEALVMSAAFTLTALALFWLPLIEAPTVYWPNLLVILVLLGQRQIARRLPERYPFGPPVHNAIIIAGGLSLWLFFSRWVLELQPGGFYLTATWSLLALAQFATGIALRERMYRWLGLAILACAVGRVVFIDVWTLKELYRILSFMALGIVLLVLGFIYSKYQEKIKEWL